MLFAASRPIGMPLSRSYNSAPYLGSNFNDAELMQ